MENSPVGSPVVTGRREANAIAEKDKKRTWMTEDPLTINANGTEEG